jgi:hypothetical protein
VVGKRCGNKKRDVALVAQNYRVIINNCPIAVGVGDVVECGFSFFNTNCDGTII